MKALIIAEVGNQQLCPEVFRLLTAAQQLANHLDVLVLTSLTNIIMQAKQLPAVETVYSIADNGKIPVEIAAQYIAELSRQYDYVLAQANDFGKNILPRAAALQKLNMVSDVIAIKGAQQYQRYIYAGSLIATITNLAPIQFLTIRVSYFQPMSVCQCLPATNFSLMPIVTCGRAAQLLKQVVNKAEGSPQLHNAAIVVSGGRGFGSTENFALLIPLAKQLHAAIGATRAAVDAGYADNAQQVGQTGQIVAPLLYLAIGISGATQHLAGIQQARYIVAINHDPQAAIFQHADLAIVGNLFDIIPQLIDAFA